MRLRAFILASVVLVAPGTAVAATGGATPTLRVVRDAPLTIRGANFRPRESVRVTIVMGPRRWSRAVRAGRAGGFTVRFARVRLDRCALPLVISAHRAGGGTVRARLPVPECAMP